MIEVEVQYKKTSPQPWFEAETAEFRIENQVALGVNILSHGEKMGYLPFATEVKIDSGSTLKVTISSTEIQEIIDGK